MRLARNKERGSNNKTNLRTSYKHRPYHAVVGGGHSQQIEGKDVIQLIDVATATVNVVELEKRRLIPLHLDQPNPARSRHCWNKEEQQYARMRPVTD